MLVTAYSQCDLAYLPRLYRYLQTLKQGLQGTVWRLDSGVAWSDEVWLSAVTEHRAAYILLDAMGYSAAFADGLSAEQHAKLAPQLQLQLWTPSANRLPWPDDQGEVTLQVAESFACVEETLHLPQPAKGTIQHYQLHPDPWRLVAQRAYSLPASTLPDPTISAAIEFVQDEARYYHKHKGT